MKLVSYNLSPYPTRSSASSSSSGASASITSKTISLGFIVCPPTYSSRLHSLLSVGMGEGVSCQLPVNWHIFNEINNLPSHHSHFPPLPSMTHQLKNTFLFNNCAIRHISSASGSSWFVASSDRVEASYQVLVESGWASGLSIA